MEQHLLQQPLNTTDVHPSPAAYTTANLSHLTSNQPSYTEMITAAILWDSSQGKAGGSSKRSIAKYIDRVYSNLPPTHSALLTHHLKRMKNSGELVMIKNSYQLPIVAAATTNTTTTNTTTAAAVSPLRSVEIETQPVDPTPKKRPGRPPKLTPSPKPVLSPKPDLSTSTPVNGPPPSTGKRPRGRPPMSQSKKQAVSEVPFVQAVLEPQADPGSNNGNFGSQSPLSSKRRPGRPSKKQAQAQVQVQAQQAEFQPIDQGSLMVAPVNGTPQKTRPGRPPRSASAVKPSGEVSGGSKSRGRGRPKRNALAPVAKPFAKKPRGRPARLLAVVPLRVGGKRRGRPPKGGVSVAPPKVKKVRKYSGKPLGRPKKSESMLAKQTANEELIKKVENMQAKVRDAVGVLKPYFANETAPEALTALQQLEDITTVDVTAPPPSSNQPVTTTTLFDDPTIEPPLEETIMTVVSNIPEVPVVDPQPPVNPFSTSAPDLTGSEPYDVGPNIGSQEPGGWIPSGGEQL